MNYSLQAFLNDTRFVARGNHRLVSDTWRQYQAASGLNEATPSDAGFLVPTELATEISKAASDSGQLRNRCRIIEATGNSIQLPRLAETSRADGQRLAVAWVDEGDDIEGVVPKFGRTELRLNKLACYVSVTDELLEDNSAMTGTVSAIVGAALAWELDNQIFRGSGVGRPLGVLSSPALITVDPELAQAADTINGANLEKMLVALHPASLRSACWIVNSEALPQLLAAKTGDHRAMVPATAPGQPDMLIGRPILWTEQSSALGDLGDIVLADLGEYTLFEKKVKETLSLHVRFLQDEGLFRFVLRVNGQGSWPSALHPAHGTGLKSPFVALAAR